ncbi:hypothetical protein ACWEPN_13940 [Nonomuraea wenchangensis]
MPRSYALAILADQPLLLTPGVWKGPEPPSRWERLWAAAEDLADSENIVVALSLDAGDFFDHPPTSRTIAPSRTPHRRRRGPAQRLPDEPQAMGQQVSESCWSRWRAPAL